MLDKHMQEAHKDAIVSLYNSSKTGPNDDDVDIKCDKCHRRFMTVVGLANHQKSQCPAVLCSGYTKRIIEQESVFAKNGDLEFLFNPEHDATVVSSVNCVRAPSAAPTLNAITSNRHTCTQKRRCVPCAMCGIQIKCN
jgi:hypothetical protein